MPAADASPALARLALRLTSDFDAARIALAGIPADLPTIPQEIHDALCSGRMSALEILHDSAPVGIVVYSLESGPWPEFVVNAAQVSAGLPEPIRTGLDSLLCAKARELGARSIRFSTIRPGLLRAALGNGYHVGEIILRKPL